MGGADPRVARACDSLLSTTVAKLLCPLGAIQMVPPL